MYSGADIGICVRPLTSHPPFALEVRLPLDQLGVRGSAISSPSWVQGGAPAAESEFGALQSCEKATGGNHFEYSEVHFHSSHLSRVGYRDGVGRSPIGGEGCGTGLTPLNPTLVLTYIKP